MTLICVALEEHLLTYLLTKQAAQKCVLKTLNRELCTIKIQIMQNQVTSFTFAAFLHGDLHLGTTIRLYRKLW